VFASKQELAEALRLSNKMGELSYDGQTITITSQTLKNVIIPIVRGSVIDLRQPNVPEYNKEIIRRIYLAGFAETEEKEQKIIEAWQRRSSPDELDSAIEESFAKIETLL